MRKVDVARWERYAKFRNQGLGAAAAAKRARLGEATAYRFEAGDPSSGGIEAFNLLGITTVGGKTVQPPHSEPALRALEDFAFFRMRYFGRKSMPWQEKAAYEVIRLHETPDREYLVNNEPPGSGKSTLFTHDIPCWLIARERHIRIMVGSGTGRQARSYLSRLKKTFESSAPVKADIKSLTAGTAHDADATLSGEFGAFKPEGRADVWAQSAITVRQLESLSLDNKEPTVSAWGKDEEFLGGRYDVAIWDDLVAKKLGREAFDAFTEWWLSYAETRLEPGGLLILQGQRMHSDDLYRFCLDMKTADDTTPKYRRTIYPAHDEALCENQHGPDAKPWPDGCLLDPYRLPHSMLMGIKNTRPRTYQLQYQQEDGDGAEALVDPVWFKGGQDSDGMLVPGCYDTDRNLGQIGETDRDGWSVISVDPSPTNYWSVGHWVMRPETNRYILVTKTRRKMGAPDFLSMDLDTGQFSGVLHEMMLASHKLQIPLTHVIVEWNAAQRYLITQPHVQKWQSAHGVTVIPHQTHSNKNDPKYGVLALSDYFRQGKIRLPMGDVAARLEMSNYVHEFTNWPDARTDDEVMMTWFAIKGIDGNYVPASYAPPKFNRPSWVAADSGRGMPQSRPTDRPVDRLMAKVSR